MARGKYETRGAYYRRRRRTAVLITCIVLLLTLVAGGTLAYVLVQTSSVQNQFQRVYVTSRVNVNDDKISVTNTGDVSAYIRAAIVVNWMDANGDVLGTPPKEGTDYTLTLNKTDWEQDMSTGFYYYKASVASNATTSDLVSAIEVKGTVPSGYALSVEVVAEAIQAQGKTGTTPAYENAWGITPIGN